jgi:pilus assembly protein Flp/PilA
MANLKKFLGDESGATAVEYGLIVAAISAVIIVVVVTLGKKMNNAYQKVSAHL